jgi:hypothetical protein
MLEPNFNKTKKYKENIDLRRPDFISEPALKGWQQSLPTLKHNYVFQIHTKKWSGVPYHLLTTSKEQNVANGQTRDCQPYSQTNYCHPQRNTYYENLAISAS